MKTLIWPVVIGIITTLIFFIFSLALSQESILEKIVLSFLPFITFFVLSQFASVKRLKRSDTDTAIYAWIKLTTVSCLNTWFGLLTYMSYKLASNAIWKTSLLIATATILTLLIWLLLEFKQYLEKEKREQEYAGKDFA